MMDASPADGGPGDASDDSGPTVSADTCEACETHDDCAAGSFCISLTVGGRACVPGCNPDIPSCPRAFDCALSASSGVDTFICLPVGGTCCVDDDADGYGQGVGCMGDDCDDADELVNPGASEICNGADDDCDGTVDNPPTDCLSGRCTIQADGTYSAIEGADCMDAMCAAGTTTACDLFTCEDGGEAGNRCAAACDPAGTDDDTYCIDAAHCDAAACAMDEGNGGTCDEDTDCASGHCDNGFCCDGGTCCGVTSDCPGGGGIARLCDDPSTCQGSRGETTCVANQCQTMMGIADDRACDSTVMARDCGVYNPIFCSGTEVQSAPSCPTSCISDTDCITAAHCEVSFCVPDRPPGASCSRNQDCQMGLTCTDGVCCMSPCGGRCESCNLPGMAGVCRPVPPMADPDGECPGFSCSGYFTGFGPGEDICYQHQPVSNAAAACNGARACMDAATLCPLQPRGSVQIDCDNTCQTAISGTCTGTTAGMCRDLDNPANRLMCGRGACAGDVQQCIGGTLQMCLPGTPTVEVCNAVDDDCDGTVDNGTGADLCAAVANAVSYACTAGVCGITCGVGFSDVNGIYTDGCECADDTSGNACGAATDLGPVAVGASRITMGNIMPGQDDWYAVSFPATGRGPGGGIPHILISPVMDFRLDIRPDCSSPAMPCGMEAGDTSSVTDWDFTDDQSTGANAYSGMHSVSWPGALVFRVFRVAPATACAGTAYTLTITR